MVMLVFTTRDMATVDFTTVRLITVCMHSSQVVSPIKCSVMGSSCLLVASLNRISVRKSVFDHALDERHYETSLRIRIPGFAASFYPVITVRHRCTKVAFPELMSVIVGEEWKSLLLAITPVNVP